MIDHDPQCRMSEPKPLPVGSGCQCHLIRKVRDEEGKRAWTLGYDAGYQEGCRDEQERIAKDIDGMDRIRYSVEGYWTKRVSDALDAAASIARNGGRDE